MKQEHHGIGNDWQNGGFGLYVHWPFCQSKCPYCDFNSHVVANVDQSPWIEAFEIEIRRHVALLGPRRLKSIFFGGGTPSLMEARTVQAVIDAAQRAFSFDNDIEITLEANPTSVEVARFQEYALAGVNRVSLGVQALNDPDLKRLGRLHSASEAIKAIETAQCQFKRVSFDLIYARQFQTTDAWQDELLRALALGTSHLSLYQLTIEDGTAFGDLYRRDRLKGLPDSDLGADMFDLTDALTSSAGLHRYETSNHAVEGEESQHNLLYWRYGDYVGIGPGAHGRLTIDGKKWETEAERMPAAWLAGVQGAPQSAHSSQELSTKDMAAEMLLMGLRINDGVSLARLLAIDPDVMDTDAIAALEAEHLIERKDGYLRLTKKGQPLLNSILRDLIA